MKSLYDVLGVARDATSAQIRAARRSAASRLHPDRDGGDAEAMAAVNKAYDVLIDCEARKRYDETGRTDKPDTLRDAVRNTLINVVAQLIEKNMIQDTVNVVATLNHGLDEAMRNLTGELARVDDKIERLEKKLEKIAAKGDASLLLDVMRGKLDELRNVKANFEKGKAVLEATREELNGYNETTVEVATPQEGFGRFFNRNNSPWP